MDGGNVHHYLEYYYALEKDQKLKHMEYIFVEDDCTYTISGLNYDMSSTPTILRLCTTISTAHPKSGTQLLPMIAE